MPVVVIIAIAVMVIVRGIGQCARCCNQYLGCRHCGVSGVWLGCHSSYCSDCGIRVRVLRVSWCITVDFAASIGHSSTDCRGWR